jgi:phosphatidylserine/phosphatidylglycerophosphate/cardiolipin synthase-like enzyme
MHRSLSLLLAASLSACVAPSSTLFDNPASEHDRTPTACEVDAILGMLNNLGNGEQELKDAGLHTRAARELVAYRLGLDGLVGTGDDRSFANLDEVDAVPQVGPSAMDALFGWAEGSCEEPPSTCDTESAALDYVNDPATTSDDLIALGMYSLGARNLVAYRDGADGLPGTPDDELLESMGEVDNVPYVGPSSIAALEAHGNLLCEPARVIFSPQWYDESHLSEVIARLDGAATSADIAMYSLSDHGVLDAIERAANRGVSIRVLYQGASEDRVSPEGTRSADLEDMGIEVRWVNKIMHHKFALVDGPRTSLDQAASATLMTGSGNWSYSAGTKYDENTVFLTGDERLVLSLQQEFELLWSNSRLVVWNETIPSVDSLDISDDDIAAVDGTEVVFTSANFRTYDSATYGPTFAKDGDQTHVADRLVALIEGATDSIDIASGHMRFRPIAEAVLAKAASNPEVAIRVYLDGQEYTSAWYYGSQVDEVDDCLAEAEHAGDEADCLESGVYFGYALYEAGIPLRYKYYAYRWDYTYAAQMHHKTLLIDGDTVASGSYNYSPNAEWDTIENVVVYTADRYPGLVSSFVENFNSIWETGRAEGRYDALLDELAGDGDVPLVFDSMALYWDEIDALKDAIQDACPDVDTDAYREDPADHTSCPRP